MADTATTPSRGQFLTLQAIQPFWLIALSAVALLSAFVFPQTGFSISAVGAGAGLAAAGVIVASIQAQDRLRMLAWRQSYKAFVMSDPGPAILTDASGTIIASNARAQGWRSNTGISGIADLLEAEFTCGRDIGARLTGLAELTGSAEECVRLPMSSTTLSLQLLPGGHKIWRRDDAAEVPSFADLDCPIIATNHLDETVWSNGAASGYFDSGDVKVEDTSKYLKTATFLGESAGLCYFTFSGTSPANEGRVDRNVTKENGELVAELPVPVVTLSANGDILSANPSAMELLNLEVGAFPKFYDLVEGMGRPITEWLADAAKGRGLLRSEFVHAVLPDKELYLQITLGRVRTGDENRLIGILNDATELKTLEAQFVQSQKMQAIGQLAGGVAHDFNNLLTAISGHCDLLLLRHDAGDPDYSDLMQIAQNANRAAALVGQLLAFSRKQTMKPQALDLRDTMSELTHLLNRLIGEKVSLDLQVGRTNRVIRADRRQFEQVIMNLVVNARDAMPSGGRIEIGAEDTVLTEATARGRAELPAGEYVLIRVSDNGTGIEPDKLPKIFEPFFTTKKTGEGTGLGLSTVYGIVKQTGGYIFAESEVGAGTTFEIYFPAHARQSPEQTPKPSITETSAPTTQGSGVVLLVEDEAPVRAFASRALKMRGYTVVEAGSAEEALDVLKDDALLVELFVTDVIMPGMDGPTWVREALKDRPNTRVVFMSGYAEEGLSENQARIPNSVFLPKPFSLTDLTSTVQRQLA